MGICLSLSLCFFVFLFDCLYMCYQFVSFCFVSVVWAMSLVLLPKHSLPAIRVFLMQCWFKVFFVQLCFCDCSLCLCCLVRFV